MGLSLCCMGLMATPSKSRSRSIKIVQLNGSVEEIEHPITVAQVTGKQPKQYFIFTQSQLLTATAAATPLKMDVQLEAGRLYFMLPSTLFQSNVSPAELAPIARKLASIAQNTLSKSKSKSKSKSNSKPETSVSSSEAMTKNSGRSSSRSWKPILSTIRERSFNRSSESDLQAQDQEANIFHTND